MGHNNICFKMKKVENECFSNSSFSTSTKAIDNKKDQCVSDPSTLSLILDLECFLYYMYVLQRDKRQSHECLEDQIGRILGKVGPSMLLTSVSESLAFFLGELAIENVSQQNSWTHWQNCLRSYTKHVIEEFVRVRLGTWATRNIFLVSQDICQTD